MRDSQTAAIKPDEKTEKQTDDSRQSYNTKMQFSSCLVISCFLSVALLSGDAFRVQPAQCVDRPVLRSSAGLRPRPRGVKMGEELTAKLLRLDDLVRMENDVMEPKRKRSFPGNNGPLDRLTVNSMETKQATSKQSKVVESPRRRVNPPPVDRIGMSRLPNSRG